MKCDSCTLQDDAFKCEDFRNLESMEIVEIMVK